MHWVMITGEYPPQSGGVADYTAHVAAALVQAPDTVTVIAPSGSSVEHEQGGVRVHRLPDHFGPRGLAEMDRLLSTLPSPRVVIVQYVPHAFGSRAMNMRFCRWLKALGRRERIGVMFHEVSFPFHLKQPLRHIVLAAVHTLMARMVCRAAEQTFVSIPAWTKRLDRHLRGKPEPIWLPVPSNVLAVPDLDQTGSIRARLQTSGAVSIVGHFGTYGDPLAAALGKIVPALVSASAAHVVLMGRGSEIFTKTLVASHPSLEGRVTATGELPPGPLAAHLAACDVFVQPYPDGISSRRSSAMAGLASGIPIVTTEGELTEPIWRESGAVALCAPDNVESMVSTIKALLADEPRRGSMAQRSKQLYSERFTLDHTIRTLRAAFGADLPRDKQ